MRTKIISLSAIAAVSVVGGAVAVQTSNASTEPAATYALFGAGNTTPTTDLSKKFADTLPQLKAFGVSLQGSKLVGSDRFRDVYAVPGTGHPCLIVAFKAGGHTSGCSEANEPMVDVSVLGTTGIVPDNVSSVDVTLDDGGRQTIKVTGNVFTAPVNASTAAYTDRGRTWKIELMPPSSLPDGAKLSADGTIITIGDDTK